MRHTGTLQSLIDRYITTYAILYINFCIPPVVTKTVGRDREGRLAHIGSTLMTYNT